MTAVARCFAIAKLLTTFIVTFVNFNTLINMEERPTFQSIYPEVEQYFVKQVPHEKFVEFKNFAFKELDGPSSDYGLCFVSRKFSQLHDELFDDVDFMWLLWHFFEYRRGVNLRTQMIEIYWFYNNANGHQQRKQLLNDFEEVVYKTTKPTEDESN